MKNPYKDTLDLLYKEKYNDPDIDSIFKGKYYQYDRRFRDIRQLFAYAIPDERAIEIISFYSPICEVGAGLGYWAKLINESGADIEAWDLNPWRKGKNLYMSEDSQPFFNVQQCDMSFQPPAHKSLFLCWPPYASRFAHDMLLVYRGEHVIYIGEGPGGCCANDEFFEHLDTHFIQSREYQIPQFAGIHDLLKVYRRKNARETIKIHGRRNSATVRN